MKKMSIFKILAIFITSTILLGACTKESPDVRLDPTLSTSQVYDVKSDSATVVGFVVASGSGFIEKGICYNTEPSPTITNNKVVYTGDNSSATYIVKLSGLDYATKYYARAYATNANGTVYGEEYNFTTLPVLATLTTAETTAIAGITATSGGNISNNGGAEIIARGVVFSETANPTLANSKTEDGTGSGVFVSLLTGLKGLTTYHVRAYATNSAGVAYGEDVVFTTLVATRVWNVPGNYVAASYPGTTLADWSPDKSPQVASLEAAPDNLEGYVYMANATNEWKFATMPNWDGPAYTGGPGGTLIVEGANIISPAGYYKINVNAAAMTYTAVATTWGVIGDASPSSWDDETSLTYEPTLRTWTGGMHMTAGAFKFRANHDWAFNYGSVGANGILDTKDNNNIPLTVEADYYFVLDLSNPNAYTYSANRWGLIGNSTPGGWDNDTNMTWDAANHALTVTLDLTVGMMKFRANDAWDVNFGGVADALTLGGADIPVAEAGNYTIKLFITGATAHYTMVKN